MNFIASFSAASQVILAHVGHEAALQLAKKGAKSAVLE